MASGERSPARWLARAVERPAGLRGFRAVCGARPGKERVAYPVVTPEGDSAVFRAQAAGDPCGFSALDAWEFLRCAARYSPGAVGTEAVRRVVTCLVFSVRKADDQDHESGVEVIHLERW